MNNPVQYLKFQSARLRPALDLLQSATGMFSDVAMVKNVVDLGCGPGNITPFICKAFPGAMVEGVDSSQEMIDKAGKTSFPDTIKQRISFRIGSIEQEAKFNVSKPYDLVFSNAALHWCNHHEALLPQIIQNLVTSNGGVLAVQMPDTREQPSHLLMETAALRCGLMDLIENVRIPRVEESQSWYYRLLAPLCKEVELWSTEYVQQLPVLPKTYLDSHSHSSPHHQRHPVCEFTRSTGLTPILQALGGEGSALCQKYLSEYDCLLEEEYPVTTIKNKYHSSQGKSVVLLPYKRFFFVCKR